MPISSTTAAALALATLAATAPASAAADEALIPTDPRIEQAVRSVWVTGGNRRPVCAPLSLASTDQAGVQELEQVFVPGQWAVRVARLPQRKPDLDKLEYLAARGLLERRDTFLNVGPIQGLPAVEYRPTLAGWAQSMSRGQPSPCFYYGMAEVLKVLGYTESERDASGTSKVTIHFLRGAEVLADWARGEAAALFPSIGQELEGRRATFDFYRGADGRLRITREIRQAIEPVVSAARTLPGIEIAREGIARTQQTSVPKQSLVLPKPCLPLLALNMPRLWSEGDEAAAARAVLTFPAPRSTARTLAGFAYARLERLREAGLVTLEGDPERTGGVVVRASARIRPLLAQHGNCLPLGEVRVEVAGVQFDDTPGERQRFKARYVVAAPAPWIKAIARPELLADLAATLRHGLYFEGVTVKTAAGWTAAYLEDRRPRPAPPSLGAIGVSPAWRNVSEASIASGSVANHELHMIGAYSGALASGARRPGEHPVGHVDVTVPKRATPVLVVLNGYEPIEWRFRVSPGARVEAVLATGYHEQSIVGLPAAVPVVTAYAPDGSLRIDPSMTTVGGGLGGMSLESRLGVRPTSAQKVDGLARVTLGEPPGRAP